MTVASLGRLLLLSAIWGASFLFMRLGAPVLGPALVVELRVGLAAVFLLLMAAWLRRPLQLRAHWQQHLVLGLFNAGLPFLLYGFAARTLPASLMAILNATTPMWAALIGAVWLRRPLGGRSLAGLLLGVAGVGLLVGFDPATVQPGAWVAIALCLGASLSYGIATHAAQAAPLKDPFANAHGSMWAATLVVAPAVPFFSQPVWPGPAVAVAMLALGVLCTGVAYLLYFRLLQDIGAAPTLTVTFLVPVFGVAWGHLLLGEPVGWHTAVGAAVVLTATALVTGFGPAAWRAARPRSSG